MHEAELTIVIGKVAKQVTRRGLARTTSSASPSPTTSSARDQMFADGQWARAKGYDTRSARSGPWMVGPSSIRTTLGDPPSTVDGEPRRHGNTRDLIHQDPRA